MVFILILIGNIEKWECSHAGSDPPKDKPTPNIFTNLVLYLSLYFSKDNSGT